MVFIESEQEGIIIRHAENEFSVGLHRPQTIRDKVTGSVNMFKNLKCTNNAIFAWVLLSVILNCLLINMQTVACRHFHCLGVKLKPRATDVPVKHFAEKRAKSTSYFQDVIPFRDLFTCQVMLPSPRSIIPGKVLQMLL